MARGSKHQKVGGFFLLLARIQRDNATLQANGYGMGSIVRAKFGQYVCNAALDGRFTDRKEISDLFIGIAGCNQP